jgi:hypothetical protein
MLDLDAIARSDAARRQSREQAELIDLAESFYGSSGSSYVDSRGLTGVPSNRNRVVRASENSWDRMARPAWSECISHSADGTASVFRPNRRDARKRGIESDAEQKRAEQLAQSARVHSSAMAAHVELIDE